MKKNRLANSRHASLQRGVFVARLLKAKLTPNMPTVLETGVDRT